MLRKTCAFALILTACAGGGANEATTSSSPTTTSTSPGSDGTFTTVVPSIPGGSVPDYLSDEIVDDVRRLAADESGVAPEDFEVEAAAQVTWSDGSLGCPQPGQSYTQALVDGYWVVLSNDGDTYDYRSTLEADFRRCRGGGLPPADVYQDR